MTRILTYRRLRPWIAFMLSVMLFIQSTMSLSFRVSAENESTEEPTIVAEDITKRTENEKHFLCSDGSMMAVSYARPVHYEKDGVWEEIDNQLEYLSEENAYVTRNGGGFDVRFEGNGAVTAQNANGFISWTVGVENTPALVTMQVGQTAPFSITTMANKANDTASIKAAAKIDYKGKAINDLSLARVEKNHAEIAFPSAFGSIAPAEVKYSLASGIVKEDIIFERESTVSKVIWTLTLSEGSTAELQENGSVVLYNGEKIIYCCIGAPYLYDNAGAEGNVQTTLTKTGDTWRLVYHLDTAWMQSDEREYPVTFDPPVYSPATMGSNNFYDTCYNIANADDTTDYESAEILHVGSYTSVNNYFTHIRFLRYSTLYMDYNEITDVNLRMYTNQYKDAVRLYRVGVNETVNGNYRLASDAMGIEGVYTSSSSTSGYFTFALDKDVYLADLMAYQAGELREEDKGYTIWLSEGGTLTELHSCESFYYPPTLTVRYRAKNLGGKAVMLKNTQTIEDTETVSYVSVGDDNKATLADQTSAEVFMMHALDNGYFTLESYTNAETYLQYNGTDVVMGSAPTDNSHYFSITADANGYNLYNAYGTVWENRYMYAEDGSVKVGYNISDVSKRTWELEETLNGVYTIQNAQISTGYIEVKDGKNYNYQEIISGNYENIEENDISDKFAHRLIYSPADDMYYIMPIASSNGHYRAISTTGNNTLPSAGKSLHLFEKGHSYKEKEQQMFLVERHEDGTVSFVANGANNGKFAITLGSNGTTLSMQTYDETNAMQRWHLDKYMYKNSGFTYDFANEYYMSMQWKSPLGNTNRNQMRVESDYGNRELYNKDIDEMEDDVHQGIDIDAAENTPLYAPYAGKIAYTNPNNMSATGGYYVVVETDLVPLEDSSKRIYYVFMHMNSFSVYSGNVTEGMQLGLSGDTGSGPAHLHYGIFYDEPDRTSFADVMSDNAINPTLFYRPTTTAIYRDTST